MNKAKIYIGNSISDGMPNTLLEAIISGAFPIQSDPGGATSEIIEDGLNGLLILNPMNVDGIKNLILKSLEQPEILEKAFHYNLEMVRPKLERTFVKQEVLKKYEQVEKDLNMSHG
jgi:glycosyltransferase involved in cell wall biosynthesis